MEVLLKFISGNSASHTPEDKSGLFYWPIIFCSHSESEAPKKGKGKNAPKTLSRPIICTCNDLFTQTLRPIRPVCSISFVKNNNLPLHSTLEFFSFTNRSPHVLLKESEFSFLQIFFDHFFHFTRLLQQKKTWLLIHQRSIVFVKKLKETFVHALTLFKFVLRFISIDTKNTLLVFESQ